MSAPDRSFLDPGQVLQHSFDDATGRIRVDAQVTANISGAQEVIISEADDSISVYGTDGAVNRQLKTDASGELQIDVISSALPSGASTSAKQDTGNASLASIDTVLTGFVDGTVSDIAQDATLQELSDKIPAVLGQTTKSGSLSVTIASDQNALPVTDNGGSLTVDGTITANAGTGTFQTNVTNTSGASAVNIQDGGNSITVDGTVSATQSGAWNINNITGTISLPTGAATESTLATLNSKINTNYGVATGAVRTASQIGNASGVADFGAGTTTTQTQRVVLTTDQTSIPITDNGGSLTVDGSVSVSNFPATVAVTQSTSPWVVSGTVTANAGTGTFQTNITNASGASAVNIQDGGNTISVDDSGGSLTVDGTVTSNIGTTGGLHLDSTFTARINTLGQKTSANSTPVVLASDQSAIPVTDNGGSLTVDGTVSAAQSGSWTVTANAGTNLNTSALALESGGNLASIKTNTDNLNLSQASTTSGQKGNLVLAATTTAAPSYTTGQSNPLSMTTAGALRIDGSVTSNITQVGGASVSLGQKTAANSIPVVLASDQDDVAATYSSSNSTTVAASATDVFVIQGSGTKTIKIRDFTISGTNTGNTNALITFIKRSTANTVGTSTTLTNIPHDSNFAAGTATVKAYTANPTLGTAVGTIRTRLLFLPSIASTNPSDVDQIQFGFLNSAPIVLRGIAESLAVSLGGVAITGTTILYISVEWTEE